MLEISGDLSGFELAELGESVFQSPESGCLACHQIGHEGLRGPDLAGAGARAAERVSGMSAEDYLYESLVDPCAYIVEGFDCIMPTTILQMLGPAKVTAMVAYLQSQGGEITITLSEETLAQSEAESDAAESETATTEETGESLFLTAGCAACHQLDATGATGNLGPNLSEIGARLTADEIRESILEPNAVIAEECPTGPCAADLMPQVLGDQLNAVQLETLVDYLSSLDGTGE
ncbi:cytochrome c [Chloroflexi bacterium TSY]|nr:cytochrome c [Chloroflexi bacterium TSY]